MPDGRSLFATVDSDLRADVAVTSDLPEFDENRIKADLAWQAWKQANNCDRFGLITQALADRCRFDGELTVTLFRGVSTVTA